MIKARRGLMHSGILYRFQWGKTHEPLQNQSAFGCAYKKLAKKSDFNCKSMSLISSDETQERFNIEQNNGDIKPLQMADLGTRTDRLSPPDNSQKVMGDTGFEPATG